MAKAMTIGGMAASALVALLFGLDLILGIPFETQSWLMDVGMLICAAIVGYLSWSVFSEIR